MSDEADDNRLGRIENKVDTLSAFVMNHLSTLPKEVGHIRGRLDVLTPLAGMAVVALIVLIIQEALL